MEKQARITKVENLKPHSRRVDVDIKKHVIAQYEQQSDDEDIEYPLPIMCKLWNVSRKGVELPNW